MIYLIKRGPQPQYHRAPFHPIIICDHKKLAKWEAGSTGDLACVWSHSTHSANEGWLYGRWLGLDIDYGAIVHSVPLPTGEMVAFVHDRETEPWVLLRHATWWSDKVMPRWLSDLGVTYPEDDFTQQAILDAIANLKGPDFALGPFNVSVSGFRRTPPSHWPQTMGGTP